MTLYWAPLDRMILFGVFLCLAIAVNALIDCDTDLLCL